MTYEIGKYYRLPEGEKGLYVGSDEEVNCFVHYYNRFEIIDYCGYNLPEWKEPRDWTGTVYVLEDSVGLTHLTITTFPQDKVIAKRTITVKEGEGIE